MTLSHDLDFYQIRIENTNRCFYKCFMCPREKMTRKLGVMSLKDFEYVIQMFKDFSGEIHLHGYGEPLIDKDLVEKIKLARKYHPKSTILFVTTLGIKVKKGFFTSLINAGLSTLVVSFYGASKESYKTIHGVDNFDLALFNIKMLSYENNQSEQRIPIVVLEPDDSMLGLCNAKKEYLNKILNYDDFDFVKKSTLHNYGDGRSYKKPKKQSICSIAQGIRKKILQITWDLKIIPCCFDYNSTIVLGDLRKESIQEIFLNIRYKNFIEAHMSQELKDYPLCQKCDRNF